MQSFVVCLDFRGNKVAESYAAGFLNRFMGIRIKPDTWVISCDTSADAILSGLKDCGAYVFIAEISGGCRAIQPDSVLSWFRRNQPDIV